MISDFDGIFTKEDFEFLTEVRRRLHSRPEGGCDLPQTVALVREELLKAGIESRDDIGVSSVVAYINKDLKKENGSPAYTIAIRADMDALPIIEQTDVPYKSQNEGIMHACGHDAHTAMLLCTARVLKRIEKDLSCRVKLIFQASEESAFDTRSGARLMCQDGVMDDVDAIIGLHVLNSIPCGKAGIRPGRCHASGTNIKIDFNGHSSHATKPDRGADSLAMAIKFSNDWQYVLTRRFDPLEDIASSICTIRTDSDSYNVVAGHTLLKMTVRTFNDEIADSAISQIRMLAQNAAAEMGGSAEVNATTEYPVNINNERMAALMKKAQEEVLGEGNSFDNGFQMGSEDFAFYARLKPSAYFFLGTGNENCTEELHSSLFNIDENAMKNGVKIFTRFVLDNGADNGIDNRD